MITPNASSQFSSKFSAALEAFEEALKEVRILEAGIKDAASGLFSLRKIGEAADHQAILENGEDGHPNAFSQEDSIPICRKSHEMQEYIIKSLEERIQKIDEDHGYASVAVSDAFSDLLNAIESGSPSEPMGNQ